MIKKQMISQHWDNYNKIFKNIIHMFYSELEQESSSNTLAAVIDRESTNMKHTYVKHIHNINFTM